MANHPTTIGRYAVIRRLGEGGMGAVYLARDPVINRSVAVKLLREGIESKDLRERFIREAQSAGRLSHVNIVAIFDVGEENGRPFIVMEYIPGRTLSEIISRRDPMSLGAKLNVIVQLCDGLAYAHMAGVVHRDIKPANLIFDRSGILKIVDFGIARLGTSGMTLAGVLMGTLSYMSPEQVTGKGVDNRSDIFAVGAVAYELLSGVKAFPGDLQDGILGRILLEPPPPIGSFVPGLDPRLLRILNRALHKDAGQRYQDCLVMREELLPLIGGLVGTPPSAGMLTDSGPHSPIVATPFTPTPSGLGGKKGTNREEAARFRAQQLELWYAKANKAFERRDWEEVFRACQQIFVFDPDHAGAVDLADRARSMQEQAQTDELLGQARVSLGRGQFDDASQFINLALDVSPGSSDALRMRLQVEDGRREADERASRNQAIVRGLADAEQSIAEGRFEESLRALDRVIVLDRTNPRAQSLRGHALAAIEQRQKKRELDERVRRAVEQATRRFSEGDRTGALLLLQGFVPVHAVVTAALTDLTRQAEEATRREEEARQAADARRVQEREAEARRLSEEARRRFESGQETGALQSLKAFMPSHPVVAATLVELEARQAELRRQREVDRRRVAELAALEEHRRLEAEQAVADEERRQHEAFDRARTLAETARERFDGGDQDGALALLRAGGRSHPVVEAMLATLERRADAILRDREAQVKASNLTSDRNDPAGAASMASAAGQANAEVSGAESADVQRTSIAVGRGEDEYLAASGAAHLDGVDGMEARPASDVEPTTLAGASGQATESPGGHRRSRRGKRGRDVASLTPPEQPLPPPAAPSQVDGGSSASAMPGGTGTVRLPTDRVRESRPVESPVAGHRSPAITEPVAVLPLPMAPIAEFRPDGERDQPTSLTVLDSPTVLARAGETVLEARTSYDRGGATALGHETLGQGQTSVRTMYESDEFPPPPARVSSRMPLYGLAAVAVLILVASIFWGLNARRAGDSERPPVQAEPGRIVISITPWARITSIRRLSDGREMSEVLGANLVTPCLVYLPPGEYNVHARSSELNLDGDFVVFVEAGQLREVTWALPGFDLSAEIGSILKK